VKKCEEKYEEKFKEDFMFMKLLKLPLALLLALVMVLAACGNAADVAAPVDVETPAPEAPAATDPIELAEPEEGDAAGLAGQLVAQMRERGVADGGNPLAALIATQERFPTVSGLNNPNPPIEGGVLRVAIPSANPVPGIFNVALYNAGLDADFGDWFWGGSVFSSTPAMTFGQHGIVTWTHNLSERSMTLTQVEDVYWHDGVPLTLGDLVFTTEVIAHPDYEGIRWGASQQNIIGSQEFRDGEADSISGLVLSADQRELKIYFYEMPPGLMHFGFWSHPMPRHIFEDIPVAEMAEHPATRVNPIGFGPFMVRNIVAGESVHLVANDNFWLGRPYLDEVVLQIVDESLVPSLMLEGQFDVVSFPPQYFPDHMEPTNFHYLGDITNIFTILNFNLGVYDWDSGYIVPDPNSRMADVRLRRAMAYAFDESLITENLWHNLRFPATSVIPPGHSLFLDPTLGGFPYNPDLARQLLDEAGFIDTTGDGWRDDQNGDPFIIQFLTREGQMWDIRAQFYIQAWADIGLRVELYQGRHHDFAAISENVWSNDNWPDVDIFEAAWQAGFDPNPRTLWGHTISNRPRYINDEWLRVMDDIGSEQAWDLDWLVERYREWQRVFHTSVASIPTDWRLDLFAVNNRVLNYELITVLHEDGLRTRGGFHRIQVTSDELYRQ
jgi:peptide/nickel transport system substrate-binding protein